MFLLLNYNKKRILQILQKSMAIKLFQIVLVLILLQHVFHMKYFQPKLKKEIKIIFQFLMKKKILIKIIIILMKILIFLMKMKS